MDTLYSVTTFRDIIWGRPHCRKGHPTAPIYTAATYSFPTTPSSPTTNTLAKIAFLHLSVFQEQTGQSIGQFLHKPLSCPLSARLKSPIICTAVSCLTEGIFRHSTSATERLTAFPLKLQPSGKTRDRPISKRPSAIPSSGYNPTEHLLSIKSCT